MLLTSPIWLLALAAISIPVAIHLWNIRPGKTLKVGSISLFTESSPKSSRSFKLMDILLLILRCLMLALLALILAVPFWQQHLKAGKAKGWILIPEVNLLQTYKYFQPRIDSLTKAGYEFHYFRQDLKKESLTELVKTRPDSIALQDSLNYWQLCRALSSKIPAALPVELFTTNTINHFTGAKPQTNLHVIWHTYTPADSVRTWPAAAWLTANGSIRVMQGTSAPSGTNYQYIDIKNGGQNGSTYQASVEHGVPVISSKDKKISVDTTTQHITIYTDKNTTDAAYLKAALNAVAQLTQRKTIIKQYSSVQNIPTEQDWLFWLSEQPIGQTLVHQAQNVFRYKAGKIAGIDSWISNADSYALSQGEVKIPLYKTIDTKPVGDVIWADGFGKAVLSKDAGTYHFYSRFNPAWNDLVWNDAFPKWLMALTQSALTLNAKYEHRAISTEQLQPTYVADNENTADTSTQNTSLANYLWLLLAITFMAERWLATQIKTTLTNG
ncbi:BatA domain-containing protein [Mucilaginibacter mali]|uniref:BatA domain-containing protein n=1 Tax=Mucilaginibacter mali TaxID=2740462 RepID=A0A7D4Q1W6_9SPHI|nr:BatA domain-containing protein [Mucilaginibacter mali]QKJ30826.1 BatA domain-containing protein [Mucilaginibacter mali]